MATFAKPANQCKDEETAKPNSQETLPDREGFSMSKPRTSTPKRGGLKLTKVHPVESEE